MLPKKNRIRKNSEFENIFKKSHIIKKDVLLFKVAKNNLEFLRFGVIVSKKVSLKAIKRNKIRRIIIGVLQDQIKKSNKGLDVVIIVLPKISEKTSKEIKENTQKCLNQL